MSSAAFVLRPPRCVVTTGKMSEWGDFQALDDDEDIAIDMTEYAKEEDSQEYKAQVGSSLQPPSIEWDAEPIQVPQGKMNGVYTKMWMALFCVFHLTPLYIRIHSQLFLLCRNGLGIECGQCLGCLGSMS
jgi:hypothetical protein